MNKKGFTLIELIVVVIVIGILATFAVPQYLKATTRARVAKAKNALALIVRAEKMYRTKYDAYKPVTDNASLATATTSLGVLSDVGLTKLTTDTDWAYTVTSGDAATFTATATGKTNRPVIDGLAVTVDQTGFWVIPEALQ